MSHHGCPERLSNRAKGFQEDGATQPTMEVLVETLTGTAFEMTVSPSDTIFAIKSKIFRVEGIPVSQQHLLYKLRELEDGRSLREAGVCDGARLRLVLGMRGGPVATRRLPPRPDLTEREDGGGKVTVLVFREQQRVHLLRLRDNEDGTYSPLDHANYSSSLKSLSEESGASGSATAAGTGGSLLENAVTMGKMLELRRRMESLCLRRRRHHHDDKPEPIQKTRSEETLSVPSLLDDVSDAFESRHYSSYEEDTLALLHDGNYTRYDYDCSFADRYTLLPPIGSRTDSDLSIQEAIGSESDRRLSDALAGSILVKSGRRDGDEAAIMEESVCLGGTSVEECHIRQDSPPLATKNLAPIPTAECGSLVVGEGWRSRGFGSSSELPPARPLASLFSSSTSDLERARAPPLARHQNTEHLHLSDERLHPLPARVSLPAPQPPPATPGHAPPPAHASTDKVTRIRCNFCKKKLSIATVHECRCGARFCAPHRYAEVHGCAYDYKAAALIHLRRANPLVSAPKLPKI